MELLTLWSVAFNGMLGTLVRLAMPTTMYVRPLWVGVYCVEVGTCAAISLAESWRLGARRLENEGYSIYILGGSSASCDSCASSAFVSSRGENGAPGGAKLIGPCQVLRWMLKVGSTICAAAAIVCMASILVERSEKLEDDLQLADCSAVPALPDRVLFDRDVQHGGLWGYVPATRLGKGVVVFVLLFVLCFLPSPCRTSRTATATTRAEEQQINAVAALHEAVLDLHEDVEHLAANPALGALAGRR